MGTLGMRWKSTSHGSTTAANATPALEREYFDVYYPRDERIPRLWQLPDSRLVHVKDLYTAEEMKTSPVYNEILLRAGRRKLRAGAPGWTGGLSHHFDRR